MHTDLNGLRNARRKLASSLYRGECCFGRLSTLQIFRKHVCRGHSILDRQIDADSSSWRHRVGRIPDAQETRPIPTPEPVYFDGEDLDLFPIAQFINASIEIRRDLQN